VGYRERRGGSIAGCRARMNRKHLRKERVKRELERLTREDQERRCPRRSWAQSMRDWGVVGGGRARSLQANGLLLTLVLVVLLGRAGTQTTTYYTIPELTAAQVLDDSAPPPGAPRTPAVGTPDAKKTSQTPPAAQTHSRSATCKRRRLGARTSRPRAQT